MQNTETAADQETVLAAHGDAQELQKNVLPQAMTAITAPATLNITRPVTIRVPVRQEAHQNAQSANPAETTETLPHVYPQAESIPTSQAPTTLTEQPQTPTNAKTLPAMVV